jgi:hypothetical protein
MSVMYKDNFKSIMASVSGPLTTSNFVPEAKKAGMPQWSNGGNAVDHDPGTSGSREKLGNWAIYHSAVDSIFNCDELGL